jgi:hypothetical protein
MEKDLHTGLMKTKVLSVVVFSSFILSIAVAAHSWQGRMGGMGDPFGLVEDESDFLIHPSGIAGGKGMDFYGGYRFNYRDVMNWDYTSKIEYRPYRGSGDEWEHNGLIGAAFPLGAGRMGLFFEYTGKRGDYDGYNVRYPSWSMGPLTFDTYQLESDLDAVALRLLYGLPMGGFKLGGEVQFAYHREKNETLYDFVEMKNGTLINYPFFSGTTFDPNLFLFMIPFDSRYWETLLRGSLEGMIGPAKIAFTLRGGFTLSADNEYKYFAYGQQIYDMDGDVKAWSMGGDLWLRYPLAEDLSLPFLLEIGYQKKTRDGDGQYRITEGFYVDDYRNQESAFQVKVGGGVDKEFVKGTRVAAGIYYNYIQNENTFVINETYFENNENFGHPVVGDYNNYPDHREHQIILKLSGEKTISPIVALRMGMNFFYGWVKEDFKYHFESPNVDPDFYYIINTNTSLDGYHYGIGAWIGGTMQFQRFSLEPFLGGGYQNMNMTGDGSLTNTFDYGPGPNPLDVDKAREEWSMGGGISIKF